MTTIHAGECVQRSVGATALVTGRPGWVVSVELIRRLLLLYWKQAANSNSRAERCCAFGHYSIVTEITDHPDINP
jgi:hypothetical protein